MVLETLHFFGVQMDPGKEEEEAVQDIVLKANPTMESMGWTVRDVAKGTFERAAEQFNEDNPKIATPGDGLEEGDEEDPWEDPGARGGGEEAAAGDYETAEQLLESIGPQANATIKKLREAVPYW